jgi:hypothetical protein
MIRDANLGRPYSKLVRPLDELHLSNERAKRGARLIRLPLADA